MKKMMVAIMLGIMAFSVAGCNGDKPKTDIGTAAVEERTEATEDNGSVDNTEYPSLSDCAELSSSITEGLKAMRGGMESLAYVSDAEALDFLATVKKFIKTSREGDELCAHYAPEEAAVAISSLEDLDDSIDSLIEVYNTY